MHTANKKQSGFSTVELTIVLVILIFVTGILASIVGSVQESYARQRPRTEALNDAQAALDMFTRLIRQAGNNPNGIAGLQAIDPGTAVGGVYRTIRIRSDWHAGNLSSYSDGDTNDAFENVQFTVANNQLLKQETPADASPVVFLDNVQQMSFTYLDSNNVVITNPPASLALISRIDITLVILSADGVPMTFTTSAFLRQR